MSIALIFRNRAKPNLFRKAILSACEIPGATEILICSGFFQNNFKGSAYLASQEGSFASKLKKSSAHVITVGVHNASWILAFHNFNTALKSSGVNLSTKLLPHYRWHAKVFIVSTVRGPVFAAIGSSNFTRNAFSTSLPFNYEADVLLWVPQARGVSARISTILDGMDGMDLIRTAYSARHNGNLTIRQRIQNIREKILTTVR